MFDVNPLEYMFYSIFRVHLRMWMTLSVAAFVKEDLIRFENSNTLPLSSNFLSTPGMVERIESHRLRLATRLFSELNLDDLKLPVRIRSCLSKDIHSELYTEYEYTVDYDSSLCSDPFSWSPLQDFYASCLVSWESSWSAAPLGQNIRRLVSQYSTPSPGTRGFNRQKSHAIRFRSLSPPDISSSADEADRERILRDFYESEHRFRRKMRRKLSTMKKNPSSVSRTKSSASSPIVSPVAFRMMESMGYRFGEVGMEELYPFQFIHERYRTFLLQTFILCIVGTWTNWQRNSRTDNCVYTTRSCCTWINR